MEQEVAQLRVAVAKQRAALLKLDMFKKKYKEILSALSTELTATLVDSTSEVREELGIVDLALFDNRLQELKPFDVG